MTEPQKSILQKSDGLFMCKDELEAEIRLEELFPSDNITFYLPSNHYISKEELGKNPLYKHFESDDEFNTVHPWYYYVNSALRECLLMKLDANYNTEWRFVQRAIIYQYDAFSICVRYNSHQALRVFTIAYAIHSLQEDSKYLEDIERCIKEQCHLDGLSFVEDVFNEVKDYVSKNKKLLKADVQGSAEVPVEDISELDWRCLTLDYSDKMLSRIANSLYSIPEKRLILKTILDDCKKKCVPDKFERKENLINFYIDQLEYQHSADDGTTSKILSYPPQLLNRERIKNVKVQRALSEYFQEYYFKNANLSDILYVFFNSGRKPLKPLILKTTKNKLVKFISFLVGKKVDDATWEYFANMISARGKPLFPLDEIKRKKNNPGGNADKAEKQAFQTTEIKEYLRTALGVSELPNEYLRDLQ